MQLWCCEGYCFIIPQIDASSIDEKCHLLKLAAKRNTEILFYMSRRSLDKVSFWWLISRQCNCSWFCKTRTKTVAVHMKACNTISLSNSHRDQLIFASFIGVFYCTFVVIWSSLYHVEFFFRFCMPKYRHRDTKPTRIIFLLLLA